MRHLISLLAGLAIGSSALANDSVASTGAGGLVLERTNAIDMASEDLFVSANKIRIHYVFHNRSPSDVETIVAFPMPDRDLGEEFSDVGDVAIPSDFHTAVAGQAVKAQLERKAVLKGKDYTILLNQLHIPIAPDSLDEATAIIDRLPAATKKRLFLLGLIGDGNLGDEVLIPRWTVKDKYWWRQRFPAGRDLIVDHRYVPGTGGGVDTPIAIKQLRDTEGAKQDIKLYCMDREFIAAVDRLSKNAVLPNNRIDYILTTGANWARPIGNFRLVVDKGDASNLVSFCENGIKKISPTQFEVRHSNWLPSRDLHVIIIEPRAADQ